MLMNKTMLQPSWKPDKPVSRGATSYHNAVLNTSYYNENLNEMVRLISQKIKEKDVVVDFGAGTGISAIRTLEKLKDKIKLWLVDNSPAWLGKAYESLSSYPNVDFFVLEKKGEGCQTLSETLGEKSVDHVISANTVHLIPNLKETFKGIAEALKTNGSFIFNSGNIDRKGRPKGLLLIDSTVYRVHDIAIEIIRKNKKFAKYRAGLNKRIKSQLAQRKFIFPYPKPIKDYLKALKDAGFGCIEAYCKSIKIKYADWLDFLRVKRLQCGILPEIGGKNPTPEEEKDRDTIITEAAHKLFKELKTSNPLADNASYQGEWFYVSAIKLGD
ncbi:class I SAM-dependent methyltransferase [Candidatus Woesearchaeota archaeon]|nr:class I SAM-dependent methyltransferase [Candidatus Woesearchaeota archaeon]